jgi:uncharacterized LabA/DUF88 family protein
MMSNTNYAIFIDLENCGGKVHTLNTIIDRVKIRGNILLGKAYGYTENFSSLKEILLSNTFQVVPSIKFGHSQKNNLDIQLVIDALEVAYKNELIDCFCIVSGDSDYTPLVGKLKSMGKHVLGISRSEVASKVFISACNEFVFLESMATPEKKGKKQADDADNGDISSLDALVVSILEERDDECMYASELKNTIVRLRPEFNERSYGAGSFGKLLADLQRRFRHIVVESNEFSVKVRLSSELKVSDVQLNKSNWVDLVKKVLNKLKEEDFRRVNPSIIKEALLEAYPGFDERLIGFKKFSDMIRALEQRDIVLVEYDEQRSMLVRIL